VIPVVVTHQIDLADPRDDELRSEYTSGAFTTREEGWWMTELVPVYSGAILGLLLGFLRPSQRVAVGALLSIVLGVCASAVTGELRISWEYVLVDIPLVAASASVCFVIARSVVHRRRSVRSDRGAYG
jgi:hypothetical protein